MILNTKSEILNLMNQIAKFDLMQNLVFEQGSRTFFDAKIGFIGSDT